MQLSEQGPSARRYTREERQSMFAWGAVGGILPTLGKIAGAIGVHFEPPELSSFWGVVVALAIYAFIGSVMARAMGETEMKQALIAGIAAPAILTNVFNGATEGKIKLTDLFFINNAIAQTAEPKTTHGSFRMITLDPNPTGPIKTPVMVRIFVLDKDGKPQEWYSGQLTSSTTNTSISIPESQARIVFNDGVDLTVPASQEDVKVDVDLSTKSGFSDGFIWALGGQPASNVQIRAYVRPKPQ
jgi:hypothetical protein